MFTECGTTSPEHVDAEGNPCVLPAGHEGAHEGDQLRAWARYNVGWE
ncbi:hypothetical protein SAMN04487905_1067 [Actinopolyspora xinjiangensis]|uniref:Uncharacterized protein n=1 Tax=Actinopolyspora xinjiangensis TaxID=405564 RepID=A0A1H0U2J8_9ACTN|nr:hypothetical protein [Actinopolyspora xinjiangensis]SDP60409.1 hypothetical protein SAMN04487905_1067 [Actinopolyspora xinjiangensis]